MGQLKMFLLSWLYYFHISATLCQRIVPWYFYTSDLHVSLPDSWKNKLSSLKFAEQINKSVSCGYMEDKIKHKHHIVDIPPAD